MIVPPCTVRTSGQRSCNQRVGCLQWLGSRAFGPAKRSGPRLLSTVSCSFFLLAGVAFLVVFVTLLTCILMILYTPIKPQHANHWIWKSNYQLKCQFPGNTISCVYSFFKQNHFTIKVRLAVSSEQIVVIVILRM